MTRDPRDIAGLQEAAGRQPMCLCPTRPRRSRQLRLLLLKRTYLTTQIPTENTGRTRHNRNVALLTPRSGKSRSRKERLCVLFRGASPGPPSRRGTESGGSPAESEKEPRQPARRSADQLQAKDHLKRTRVTGPGSSLPGTPADLPGSSGGAQRSGTPRPVRQLAGPSPASSPAARGPGGSCRCLHGSPACTGRDTGSFTPAPPRQGAGGSQAPFCVSAPTPAASGVWEDLSAVPSA